MLFLGNILGYEYWTQQYSQYSVSHIEWDILTGC